jgi:hypothetical protein
MLQLFAVLFQEEKPDEYIFKKRLFDAYKIKIAAIINTKIITMYCQTSTKKGLYFLKISFNPITSTKLIIKFKKVVFLT